MTLFLRHFHGDSAPVLHADVFQRHIPDAAVRQSLDQNRVSGIRILHFQVSDHDVPCPGHGISRCGAAGVCIQGQLVFPERVRFIPNIAPAVFIPFSGIIGRRSVFPHSFIIGGIDPAGMAVPGDRKGTHPVHADLSVTQHRRPIPCRGINRPFLALGQHPFLMIQADLFLRRVPGLSPVHRIAPNRGKRLLPAVPGHRETVPDPQTDKDWRGTDLPHAAILKQDIVHVRRIAGLQADPPGADECHPSHGNRVASAAGLRPKFHPAAGLAPVRGRQLIPGIFPGEHAARVEPHDPAVLHQDVPHGGKYLRSKGGLQTDGVIIQGIENRISQRHLLASVQIQGIPGGVHQQTIHPDIPASAENQGKMASDQEGKVRQDHLFAAVQRDSFVAEPAAVMPPFRPFFGKGGIPPIQNIFQRLSGLSDMIIASVDHPGPCHGDAVKIPAIDQAVCQIGVPVILNPGKHIHLRLVIISALGHRPGRPQHRPFFQMQGHIALHADRIHGIDSFRNQHSPPAVFRGAGNQFVDDPRVFHRACFSRDAVIRNPIHLFPVAGQILRPDVCPPGCLHLVFVHPVPSPFPCLIRKLPPLYDIISLCH